jgi:hypothetical protein
MWTFGYKSAIAADGIASTFPVATAASSVIVLGAIVLLMPNTNQIMNRYWMATDGKRPAEAALCQRWR